MGNDISSEKKPFQYGEFVPGEEKPGETKILRKPDHLEKGFEKTDPKGYKTMLNAFDASCKEHGNKNFLGTRKFISKDKYGEYQWKTFQEIKDLSIAFLNGIEEEGLCPQVEDYRFLGIYSKNREEWLIAYLGCQRNSISIATIYDTLGIVAIEFILNQTQLTSAVVESRSLGKILTLKKENKLSQLTNLIVLKCEEDTEAEKNIDLCTKEGLKIFFFEDIIKKGKESKKKIEDYTPSGPDSILAFCYTSGTTGNPKGAMIPNQSLLSAVWAIASIDIDLNSKDVYLSFLPLAHIMEQLIMCACIYVGAAVGFFSGNPLRIPEDCKELRPTFFCGVPRIFTRIYDKIMDQINSANFVSQAIAKQAIKTKLVNYEREGILTHSFYDPLVFNKIKALFGGNIRWMLVGSAPMPSDILKFLRIAFCCQITEGYGQTEDCAGVLLASIHDNTAGHLGGPCAACELKLIDVPELGYTTKDVNPKTGLVEPRGEICIRGTLVFRGYFKDPEKTKEAIDEDGWLHSGDIGVIMTGQGNAIKIIDRAKNIFKLSQGEYIASEKVEGILSQSKYVSQLFIHGESLHSYIIAILVPEKKPCIEFLKGKGIDTTPEEIFKYYNNEDLKQEILKDLAAVGKKNDLKGFELPKKIYLESEPFSIENNMLTPTMKLRVTEVKKKYKDLITELYQE